MTEEDTFRTLKRKFKFGQDLFNELYARTQPHSPFGDSSKYILSFTQALHDTGWNVEDYFNELTKISGIDQEMRRACLITEKQLYGN